MQFSNEASNYNETIMVECGISYKDMIRKSIECDCTEMLLKAKCCLVTHGHSDHSRAIRELQNNRVRVYATKETHENMHTKQQFLINDGETKCIAPKIVAYGFKVEHDFPNSLGYIIQCQETNETILFVNDCKYFQQDLSAYYFDYIFIECNYETRQTYAIYNQKVKSQDADVNHYKRVIESHMGSATTKKILSKLHMDNCKAVFLMHLSDKNANEYVMKKEISDLIKVPTFVCQKRGGIK